MGQYAYIINKEKRIRCESHKISGGGEESLEIEKKELLAEFLDYCRRNSLMIECVSEHWFDNINYETEKPFIDFMSSEFLDTFHD